jgi:flagellar biosynthesis/type III secretory pathway M-ring protein FliF/YscJ
MYKITNKKTGFSQYRNAKNLVTFIKFNSHKKYNIEEIEAYDIKNFLYMILTISFILVLTFAFMYYGL